MKKLLLLVVFGVLFFGCDKSSDNDPDPDPTPTENYTVTYSFISVGLDTLEYIRYLNADGAEITITDTNEYVQSFEQPANKINAKISLRGATGTMITAYADYSLKVTDKNDAIIYIKESSTDGPEVNFSWSAEYKDTEN